MRAAARVTRERYTLLRHQEAALEWARTRRHPALFLEMRLGKTLVAIRFLQREEVERVLVVAPISVIPGWGEELSREREPWVWIKGDRKRRMTLAGETLGPRTWNLIGYEALRATPELAGVVVKRRIDETYEVKPVAEGRLDFDPDSMDVETVAPYDAVILDESTKIKNPKALVTKVCTRGFRGALHRLVLTGMPDPEGQLDLFTQLAFCTGRFMGFRSFWGWRAHYFQPGGYGGYEWQPKDAARDLIRQEVRRVAFRLMRKEAGIGTRKVRQRRVVEMNAEQRKAYKLAVEEFAAETSEGTIETAWALTRFTWMHRIAGGFDAKGEKHIGKAKLSELLDLLQRELAGDQVVVWFRFLSELEAVRVALISEGITVGHLTGDTPKDARGELVAGFRRGDFRVALCQVQVGRYGLDLSSASTAVYYSNSFAHEDRAQSEDRIAHPKKEEPLLILDLVTEGTVDEDLLLALGTKRWSAAAFARHLIRRMSA